MKRLKIILLLFCLFLASNTLACDNHVYQALLVKVVDGDTVDVVIDMGLNIKLDARIRVHDIDTPETWRPKSQAEALHGARATELAKLLLSKPFKLRTYGYAEYNRVEADIILFDNRDFARVMIDSGMEKLSSYPPDKE